MYDHAELWSSLADLGSGLLLPCSLRRWRTTLGSMQHPPVAVAKSVERYQVTITYSEPTYARARGIEEHSYSGVFHVCATDPDDAVLMAIEMFREAERSSWVSWAREIQTVTWCLIGDCGGPGEPRIH